MPNLKDNLKDRRSVDTGFPARQQSVPMRNLCCFVLLLFCTARGCAQSDFYLSVGAGQEARDIEKELLQLETQWAEAGVKGDVGFFERTAAADFVIVDCDGSVRNKQQEIANFRQEAQTSSTVEDMKVSVFARSAVVVGKFTITGTSAGQPNNLSGTFTDVWIKLNRTWQLASTQNTCKPIEALPDGDLSTQALAKEKEILEAQNRNDWTAFANLLADDLVAVDEDGIHSKKEVLDEIRAAEVRFSDYKMENVKVIPQANGAIVAYRETLVGTQNGKPFTWHIYTHSHWERRGGKWLMTMFQDSMAKE